MRKPEVGKFAGCIIGQCVGDALGFIVEGHSPATCTDYVDRVVRGGNTSNLRRGPYPFGQYSDDSQLARELMISVVECGGFNPSDYARRIAELFAENRVVGRGAATTAAASRLIRGIDWTEAGEPSPSAGNGSAMRAAPVALLCYGNPESLIQTARDQSRITHQDSRCTAGSIAIAGAAALNLQENNVSAVGFATQLSKWVEFFDPILAAAIQNIPRWLNESPATVADEVSKVGIEHGFENEWHGISPFVTGSVLWSIYSFLRSPYDYMESICTAIAVGGDVDTTAAMTGAISGALVGLDGIPTELALKVNDVGGWGFEELLRLSKRFHAMVTT
jgi:ADP-ribosylglycohydrolase